MNNKIQISIRLDSELLTEIDRFTENRTEVIHYFLAAGFRNNNLEQSARALSKRFGKIENDIADCEESLVRLNDNINGATSKLAEAYNAVHELNKAQMKTLSSITTRVATIKGALQSAQKVLWGIVVGISVLGLGGIAWWGWFANHFLL